jgi:hypothetical protein
MPNSAPPTEAPAWLLRLYDLGYRLDFISSNEL